MTAAKPDITYCQSGEFVSFFPKTQQGHQAWNELAAYTDGTGNFLPHEVKAVCDQLRRAGYRVRKTSPQHSSRGDDLLLQQLQS